MNGAAAKLAPAEKPVVLTDAQTAILQWIAHGKTSRDIALLMNLESAATVDAYLTRIYNKTGTFTRGGAIAWAMRRGLIR